MSAKLVHSPPETSANLYKTVIKLAAPSWVELLLSQLTNVVDMMMVGSLGSWALSAVGLSSQPKFLLMAAFFALNAGTTALISRFRGMGEQEDARSVLRQSIMLNLAASFALAIVGYFAAPFLIEFMNPETAKAHEAGTQYLQVQLVGFPLIALTACISASLRGVGNTRAAMVYNLVANAVNVVGNYLLIEGNLGFPRLEVVGASVATVIGQAVALALAIVTLLRQKQYVYIQKGDNWKPDNDLIRRMLRIGLPAMAEQIVIRGGMIAYLLVINALGEVVQATHQACISILGLSFVNGDAFSIAAASLTGQSLGREKPELAEAYIKCARRLGMAISLAIGIIFFLFGAQIIGLYSKEPEVITLGSDIMRLMAFIMPFQGSALIVSGALRGAGDTRMITLIMILCLLFIRPLLALLMVNGLSWGLVGAWLALMTDQILRMILTLLRLRSGRWKTIRV